MPRLTPRLIRHASRINRHLPLLLRECRDLESASNELRWMREAITANRSSAFSKNRAAPESKIHDFAHEKILAHYVERRARGEPLQYILGTQPFGELEIKCRPGVLIPRPETEDYTLEVARILKEVSLPLKKNDHLSVVDFCTGTGCIALLLHSQLKPSDQKVYPFERVSISGFDISQHALKLSHENLDHNISLRNLHEDARHDIQIEHLDVLKLAQKTHESVSKTLFRHTGTEHVDVIISNPPYISPAKYKPGGQTARSVRDFEPILALVPPDDICFKGVDQADQFYAALVKIAAVSKARLLVMEVGDTEQAIRVRDLCRMDQDVYVEIWRDDGTIIDECSSQLVDEALEDTEVEARAVVVWFDPVWSNWRKSRKRNR